MKKFIEFLKAIKEAFKNVDYLTIHSEIIG